MFPLSHKEIIDMLFIEYPNVAKSAEFSMFCLDYENDRILKKDFEEMLIDVLCEECRQAFEAGFNAAIRTVI